MPLRKHPGFAVDRGNVRPALGHGNDGSAVGTGLKTVFKQIEARAFCFQITFQAEIAG